MDKSCASTNWCEPNGGLWLLIGIEFAEDHLVQTEGKQVEDVATSGT